MRGVERTVQASTFKARCLALIDEVAATGEGIVVTKRGKPVARLVPVEGSEARPLPGSVRLLARADRSYYSTGESWDAEAGRG